MKNRTMRILRMLADIRHAQRCTALRAARAAAEIDRALKEPRDPELDEDDGEGSQDESSATPGSRIRSPR
ncbi:hypothetical protein [Burkholderia guangdongensis]|uniref:hypothetical protein n=1 Tax=Burkholderia guangdongensis TaxID=1792500 RepID=UPI0015CE783C|nr:hypothetical protein [Burkholderia guangdongensis]